MGPIGNHFTELVQEARRTQGTDAEMVELVLQTLVCSRCEKGEGSEAMDCHHLDGDKPSWHSSEKAELARKIGAANPSAVLQEQKNFIGGSTGNVFNPVLCAEFLKRSAPMPRSPLERPVLLMLTIDPSLGGECDTAFTLEARFYGSLVMCGMGFRKTRGTQSYKQYMREVDAALSADPWLGGCRVIVLCENNSGFAGGVTAEALSNTARYYHPILRGEDPGIYTGTHNKASYARSLNAILESKQLVRLDRFLIVHGEPEREIRHEPDEYRRYICDKLYNQLIACRYLSTNSARSGINSCGGWSGKSNNTEDDGAVSLAIAAEADRKWKKTVATSKGLQDSYITAKLPSDIVDAWGKTKPLR